MQSLDLFTIVFGAIAESFGRAVRGLSFILIGASVCAVVITINSLLFQEFLPLIDGIPDPAEAGKSATSLKHIVIFVIALVVMTIGMVTNVRNINMNFAFLSLMVGGALLTLYISAILGLQLNDSICWLLVIFILVIFQIVRQFQIVNTRRWEARLDSIHDENLKRRYKKEQYQLDYIKQMEKNS